MKILCSCKSIFKTFFFKCLKDLFVFFDLFFSLFLGWRYSEREKRDRKKGPILVLRSTITWLVLNCCEKIYTETKGFTQILNKLRKYKCPQNFPKIIKQNEKWHVIGHPIQRTPTISSNWYLYFCPFSDFTKG